VAQNKVLSQNNSHCHSYANKGMVKQDNGVVNFFQDSVENVASGEKPSQGKRYNYTLKPCIRLVV